MDLHEKAYRLGLTVIAWALILRLLAGDAGARALAWARSPETQSFLLYLETGRVVRFSPSLEKNADFAGESAAPADIAAPAIPVFTAQEGEAISMTTSLSLSPDLPALLTQPLNWDLTGKDPTVLILHTHTTESYTRQGESYTESSAFRTLDEDYNMLSIGDALAAVLESKGISVLHDRTLHDYPSYNGSYSHARSSICDYLEQYPSICLVLDLHRDASGDIDNQMRTHATVNGESSAQIMLVMGTDAAGLHHPDWQTNLALGVKLQAQLERLAPGITRPINLRAQRFNQDLTPGSLLIEIGAAGNTHQEAIRAAEVLGQAIAALSHGANTDTLS